MLEVRKEFQKLVSTGSSSTPVEQMNLFEMELQAMLSQS